MTFAKQGKTQVITSEKTDIAIYQISGTIVHSKTINSDESFYVRSGVYIVRTNNAMHKVVVKWVDKLETQEFLYSGLI